MLMFLVFKLSGQADTGGLSQLLYLWLLQKDKQDNSSPSMEHPPTAAPSTTNPVVLKNYTQTYPHKKIYAIFGSQHYH